MIFLLAPFIYKSGFNVGSKMMYGDVGDMDLSKPDFGCTVGCLLIVLSAGAIIASFVWLTVKLTRWIYS